MERLGDAVNLLVDRRELRAFEFVTRLDLRDALLEFVEVAEDAAELF